MDDSKSDKTIPATPEVTAGAAQPSEGQREIAKHAINSKGHPQSITFNTIEDKILFGATELERFFARVVRRLNLTAGARFETARRHKSKNRASTASIIVLTMYAILFSMISTLPSVETKARELLSMLSIFMSSFIAAFSLFEASKRYDARSEGFLRCAVEMQCLRDKAQIMLFSPTCSWDDVKEIEGRYGELLHKYTDNHAVIDYHMHRASIGKLDKWRRFRLRIRVFFNIWGLFMLSIISPAIVIMLYMVVRNVFLKADSWMYILPATAKV
jgi:hypothetical protein